MRHIIVMNAKGGCGKSTLATNLASYYADSGYGVALADYDPQRSGLDWLERRPDNRAKIAAVAGYEDGLKHVPRSADVVIIDAPARSHGKELTDLVRHAETIIVPVLPSTIDMQASDRFIKELKAVINPVAEITAKAHAVGAHVVVDGVAYAPHGFPDVSALDVDVYLFSLYKTYGPHQGLMCVRRALLDRLTPQGHFFNSGFPRKRLIPAGPDHAQIAAATGIADYFDAVHAHHFDEYVEDGEKGRVIHDLFRAREISLLTPLLDWLRSTLR